MGRSICRNRPGEGKKEDIAEYDSKITITIPKPEILLLKLNHEKSKEYYIEWGGFSSAELVDEDYKNAELAIIEKLKPPVTS